MYQASAYVAGEWFCPRCRSELAMDDINQPIYNSLVLTRLMQQEDCYRGLAAALGDLSLLFMMYVYIASFAFCMALAWKT